MLYLLYGSDIQRSNQKLNEIIEEYRKKYGGLDIYRFDAEEDAFPEIRNAIEAFSLFTPKKLVVLKYVSLAPAKEEFYRIFEKFGKVPDTTLVLWDRELEAKDLSELRPYCDKTQEFKLPAPGFAPGKNADIFKLGDTFFTSPREGLRTLLGLLKRGHDEFNLFAYLTGYSRTLLVVRHFLENKKPVPAKHGIHPFVVKKVSAFVGSLPKEQLLETHQRFFEEDRKVKVGISKPKESLFALLGRSRHA